MIEHFEVYACSNIFTEICETPPTTTRDEGVHDRWIFPLCLSRSPSRVRGAKRGQKFRAKAFEHGQPK